jgi:Transmembrane secretion effector
VSRWHVASLFHRVADQPQLRPFRSGDFRLLWIGMAASLLGDGVLFVAMPWLVLSLEESTAALALTGTVMAVASLPAALFAGVLTNRFGARRVMLAGDAIRAVVLAVIGVLGLSGSLALWHVIAGLAVVAAGEAIFIPAFGAMVQSVVAERDLVGANAADQVIRPLMWRLIGPALGGLLVAAVGASSVFILDALTFVVSFGCLLKVGAEREPVARDGRVLAEMVGGWLFVWRTRWLFYAFAAGSLSVIFVMGPWNVLVPFLVRNGMDRGAEIYGLILSVGGIGQVIGAAIVGRGSVGERTLVTLYFAWAVTAGGMLGFAVGTSLLPALVGSFVINAALAVSAVLWGAVVQTAVPRTYVARVFGIDWTLSQLLTPVSYIMASSLAGLTSARTALFVAAVAGLTCIPAVLVAKQARRLLVVSPA